jgi:hypothetical protein
MDQVGQPGDDGTGDVGVLGDEVARTLEAMHRRLRQPGAQVGQVAVAEHRVGGTPQEQGGDVGEVGEAVAHRHQRVPARVCRIERDVPDEAADRRAARSAAVGGQVAGADRRGQAGA